MPSPSTSWPRVQRLDAAVALAQLNVQTGARLELEGPCDGGQVGAAYVRWPSGRRAVLKWRPKARLDEMEAGPFAVAAALRAAGYPAPATELAAQVGDAVVTVQELLPGRRLEHFDEGVLEQALTLNELQAGRLIDNADVPAMPLWLRSDGTGYCLHRPLREHSRRTAALERWVVAVGADGPDRLPGGDAVHTDFQPDNLLVTGPRISGVVDWDAAGRGHRRFDLVTLRFGVHAVQVDPAAVRRLDDVLDAMPEPVLRLSWAHMSLRMVDWAIRHFGPADVEHWLDLAEQRVG